MNNYDNPKGIISTALKTKGYKRNTDQMNRKKQDIFSSYAFIRNHINLLHVFFEREHRKAGGEDVDTEPGKFSPEYTDTEEINSEATSMVAPTEKGDTEEKAIIISRPSSNYKNKKNEKRKEN